MGKKFTKPWILIVIFIGGITTGTVIAQEVEIGSIGGNPFVKFNDLTNPGHQYEIILNDGNGLFQIRDITNNRASFTILDNGNVGVGADENPPQDFTIGCTTGVCNIQTRAFAGDAKNTVKTLGGVGDAIFFLQDSNWDQAGAIRFEITTSNDGRLIFRDITGSPNELDILEILLTGPDKGQVKFNTEVVDSTGTCVINCP